MKCEECLELLEEYLDGELDRPAAGRVRAHLNSCAACVEAYREMEAEQAVFARYRRDVEVTPAHWAAIQSRLAAGKSPRRAGWLSGLGERLSGLFVAPRLSPALAAALVVVTVGLTVAVMSFLNTKDSPPPVAESGDKGNGTPTPAPGPSPDDKGGAAANTQPDKPEVEPKPDNQEPERPRIASAPPAPRKPPAAKAPTPEQLVREAEQKYQNAIAILSRDIKPRRSELDPQTLARFDNALFSVDATIAETREAVRRNPQDPVALGYMLSAYSKKVELLREMAREQ